MQRKSDALIALAPLVAIGQATDAEAAQVAALPVRAGLAPAGSLTTEELDALDAVDPSDPTRAIFALLNEVLPRIYAPDLGRFGLTQRDRVVARSGHPIRTMSDRIAAIFGIPDHQLYVQEVHSGGIEIELTDPISVIVPGYFSTLPEPQQVFLLGRIFASMARRLHVVDRLPITELEMLLVAALRAVVPGAGNPMADEASVSELSRKIIKNLSRRGRRALEDAVPLHPQRLNMSDWLQRARIGSARAALVVADELPASVTLHRRLEGDLGGLQGEALARGMRIAEDLLRFWVSEPAFKLRRRLGMM